MPVRAYLSLSLTMAEQMPSMCCTCLSGTPCLAHAACMSNCLPRAFSGPGSSEQASEDGSQGPGGLTRVHPVTDRKWNPSAPES